MFRNWIGRSQEDSAQARDDWMNGTRFGEVKSYADPPIPAPELPSAPLKARGRRGGGCAELGLSPELTRGEPL